MDQPSSYPNNIQEYDLKAQKADYESPMFNDFEKDTNVQEKQDSFLDEDIVEKPNHININTQKDQTDSDALDDQYSQKDHPERMNDSEIQTHKTPVFNQSYDPESLNNADLDTQDAEDFSIKRIDNELELDQTEEKIATQQEPLIKNSTNDLSPAASRAQINKDHSQQKQVSESETTMAYENQVKNDVDKDNSSNQTAYESSDISADELASQTRSYQDGVQELSENILKVQKPQKTKKQKKKKKKKKKNKSHEEQEPLHKEVHNLIDKNQNNQSADSDQTNMAYVYPELQTQNDEKQPPKPEQQALSDQTTLKLKPKNHDAKPNQFKNFDNESES
jgi:hypothetical protein